jgi:hypothetical protein
MKSRINANKRKETLRKRKRARGKQQKEKILQNCLQFKTTRLKVT